MVQWITLDIAQTELQVHASCSTNVSLVNYFYNSKNMTGNQVLIISYLAN